MKEPKHYLSVETYHRDSIERWKVRLFVQGQPAWAKVMDVRATEEVSDQLLLAYQAEAPTGPWFVFDQESSTFSEVGQPEVAPAPAPKKLVVLGTSRPTRGSVVVWYTLGDSQELWTTVRATGGEKYQQVTCWYCADGSCRFQPNKVGNGKPGKKDGAQALETIVVSITDRLA